MYAPGMLSPPHCKHSRLLRCGILSLRWFIAFTVCEAGLVSLGVGGAQATTITTLARLGSEPDGYHAKAALVVGPDGSTLYGTTKGGGPANCGTIYKITPDGTLTTLYSFTCGSDGANPVAKLTLGSDGNFYGTTSIPDGGYGAGSDHVGTVFEVTPAGVLTTIHTFSALGPSPYTNAEGAGPLAALTLGPDGNFYGTTTIGGSNGVGTIFKITPAGAVTALYHFPGGFYPNRIQGTSAALVLGNDGNFYGSATGGDNGGGLIYRITPAGVYTVIYTFPDGASGYGYTVNTMISGTDGALYGTSQHGNTNPSGGASTSLGTIFRITTDGALTFLHDFGGTGDGKYPLDALVQASDGNFYGTTSEGGPSFGYGTVFQMTPTGAVTVLYTFSYTEFQGTLAGANPQAGLVQGSGGLLYGTTGFGDFGDTDSPKVGPGTVFKITTAGDLTTLHAFINGGYNSVAALKEIDKNFYGVSLFGGAHGGGTIFGLTPDGSVQATSHDFDPATEGNGPAVALVRDKQGNIFGATSQGGPGGGGTSFQAVPESSRRSGITPENPLVLHFLLFVNEVYPTGNSHEFADLILSMLDADIHPPGGKALSVQAAATPTPDVFYGVGSVGGPSGAGGILAYTEGDSSPSYPYNFGSQPNDGHYPVGLVEGNDGSFYGVTTYGGPSNLGTIFKFTFNAGSLTTGTLETLYSFKGTGDGAAPMAGVVFGADGNLYGTTSAASGSDSSGLGTVFRIATDGTKFTVLHTSAGSAGNTPDGSSAAAPLFLASDGKLYGTTSAGGEEGAHNGGTVFSISPDGTYTLVGTLSTINGGGSGPKAALIQGDDGNLYGTTSAGGNDGSGVVFRVDLAGASTRLLNISTRLDVQTGDNVLIAGFIITGSDAKSVLLRGIGPSLAAFGLSGVLADPVLELHEPDGTVVTNNDWKETQESAIAATGLQPSDDLESAILATVTPGAYTVILKGNGNGTGVGVVEAYDLDSAGHSTLANISTRGLVQTDDNVLIGGFIAGGGGASASFAVRGLGPSLASAGVANVLQDPTLELHNSDGAIVASNDNWMDDPNKQVLIDDGLAPPNAAESALIATLAPGAYTAIVRGANNTTGVGIVEVYNLQ
jgi:uncharacterized repeat protein (TIGR03803 family)